MDNLSKRQKVVKILPPAGGSRLTSWVMWGDTSAAKKDEMSVLLETVLIGFCYFLEPITD